MNLKGEIGYFKMKDKKTAWLPDYDYDGVTATLGLEVVF